MESILSTTSVDGDNYQFERILIGRGFTRIAGTDEVGRGPLAGPVVAACVVLPTDCDPTIFTDSKKTTEKQRYRHRDILYSIGASIGIGIVPCAIVDSINIHQASLLAMKQSIEDLSRKESAPDFILVDGRFCVAVDTPQEALIKGDNRSASIAAASVIAKITRDEIMAELHQRYPEYQFVSNKGYPTKAHRLAVRQHGPCPEHRVSFKGVKEFVQTANQSR